MWKTFWQYSKKRKWLLLIVPILVMSEVIAELQQPNLLAKIVNTYQAGGERTILWTIGIQMIGFLIFSITSFFISIYLANYVAAHFGQNLRQALFKKIQNLSLAQIEKLSVGSLLTRLTNDVNKAQSLLIQILRLAIRAPLMFLGSLFFLAHINLKLLIIVLILIPIIIITIIIIGKISSPLFRQLQKALDQLNNQLSESLAGIKTVKSFNREKYEVNKFNQINQAYCRLATKSTQVMAVTMPLMMFVLNLAIAFTLWQGAQLINSQTIEIGSLIAAIGYLSQLLFSFLMISFIFINIMRTKISLERINEVLTLTSTLTEKQNPLTSTIKKGAIEFKHVSFAYQQKEKLVLKDFNLKIAAGESIGFIGATGSGKTTLALLLNRLYDPLSGEILIDGHNLKDYPMAEIKQKITLVLQEAILTSGTIEDNLLWGDKITDEKINKALKISQAEKFVLQEKRTLKSPVTRRGSNFSGGQKQRLSLARALTRDFKILILDDTTSALDFRTASIIQATLKQNFTQTTKIIISQRISSVKDCDRIVVIDSGKINGLGTHLQLLKNNDIYQKINQIQGEEA